MYIYMYPKDKAYTISTSLISSLNTPRTNKGYTNI